MVVDNASHTVFLFGGWDGSRDLADFLTYHVPSRKWSLLSPDTEAEGGPMPRPVYRHIFVGSSSAACATSSAILRATSSYTTSASAPSQYRQQLR